MRKLSTRSLRYQRKKAGIKTCAEAAHALERLGHKVSATTLQNIERPKWKGGKKPSLDLYIALCTLYGAFDIRQTTIEPGRTDGKTGYQYRISQKKAVEQVREEKKAERAQRHSKFE